jgi:hypothetical protein
MFLVSIMLIAPLFFPWSARVAARPEALNQVHILEMLTTNGFDCGFDSALNTTFEGNPLFTGKQK